MTHNSLAGMQVRNRPSGDRELPRKHLIHKYVQKTKAMSLNDNYPKRASKPWVTAVSLDDLSDAGSHFEESLVVPEPTEYDTKQEQDLRCSVQFMISVMT